MSNNKNVKKAIRSLRWNGVKFINGEIPIRRAINIKISNDVENVELVSPFFYKMNETTLIRLYERFTACGLYGKFIFYGITFAVSEISQSSYNSLMYDEYDRQDMAKYLLKWVDTLLSQHNISCKKVDKSFCKKIHKAFGGYKGFRSLTNDIIYDAKNTFSETPNVEKFPLSRKCLTCRNCKFTYGGYRECTYGGNEIPETLTVKEVNELCSYVTMEDRKLCTDDIPIFEVSECEHYVSR